MKVSDHIRNVGPMMESPRCGARTRSGEPCRAPATRGNKRCRMHGGAKGSGAPKGNQNALKHGAYSADFMTERQAMQALIRRCKATLAEFGEG